MSWSLFLVLTLNHPRENVLLFVSFLLDRQGKRKDFDGNGGSGYSFPVYTCITCLRYNAILLHLHAAAFLRSIVIGLKGN